jgi:hypothetical protein
VHLVLADVLWVTYVVFAADVLSVEETVTAGST